MIPSYLLSSFTVRQAISDWWHLNYFLTTNNEMKRRDRQSMHNVKLSSTHGLDKSILFLVWICSLPLMITYSYEVTLWWSKSSHGKLPRRMQASSGPSNSALDLLPPTSYAVRLVISYWRPLNSVLTTFHGRMVVLA